MNVSLIFALLAGMFFGVWPMVMQKSNLNGYMQSVVFSGVLLFMTMWFAWSNPGDLSKVRWPLAVIAAVIGGLGTILYMTSIAKTVSTNQSIATVVLMQVLTQTMIPVIVEAVQDKTIGGYRASGCILALSSLYLLTRK